MNTSEPPSVAVIGAGITGLTAAIRLAEAGWRVTVLERAPGVGGLAAGVELCGTSIERTYHHIFTTDESIIAMAEELGVGDTLMWLPSSMGIFHGGRIHPFNGPLDLLRFSPLPFLSRIRTGLVALYLGKRRSEAGLVGRSAFDWMRTWAGKASTDVIWGPLLRGKFHGHYRDVSMAWLWSRMQIRAASRDGGERLGYFRGGFAVLVDAMRARLEELGVEVRTGVVIDAIGDLGDRVLVRTPVGTERFDRCVATIPNHVFASLIEDDARASREYVERLRSVDYLGAVVAVFDSDQELGRPYWLNVNEPDAPFLAFLNHTQLVPDELYGGRKIYYIGTYVPHEHRYFEMTDEQLLDEWYRYVGRIYPGFDRERVGTVHLTRFRNAQHVADTEYADKIVPFETDLPNVLLANFSQLFPVDRGTNFAVRDGERVAAVLGTANQVARRDGHDHSSAAVGAPRS